MGRHHWDIEKMTVGDTCFAMSTQDGYVGALSRDNAESIKASHNADCDVYEQRIAELEEERDAAVEFAHTTEQAFCTANAELAHVKAESLRVVPVGEAVKNYSVTRNKLVLYEGELWKTSNIPYQLISVCNGQTIDPPEDAMVQVVRRLERWEATE